jgi:pseudouridine synthase
MNKPTGCVTSTFDPHEKTIMSLVSQKYKDYNVYPVGRLDKDTEGLIILTNDGDFANKIMHPSNNTTKTYEGVCIGRLSKKDIETLRRGVKLDEGIAKCKITIEPDKEQTVFEIILETGWTRQIRRMFDAIGHEVKQLRRTKIGNLTLKELDTQELKEYTKTELEKKIY